VDFSATPFYGSGTTREYFPHIVYDFDLVQGTWFMEGYEVLIYQLIEGLPYLKNVSKTE